jgi:hypothetical protein
MQAEQGKPGEQRPIPFMAIHSRNDCTVNVKASENIRDSWISRYGLNQAAVAAVDCSAEGVACMQTKYGPALRPVVETVFYDGGRSDNLTGSGSHYWVGDGSGHFANPKGPSTSQLLWTFFQDHPFSENSPPTVAISSATATGTSITVSGSASASTGSIREVAVRLDGRFPQPPKIASGTSGWTVTFGGLPDNASYVPVAIAKDSDELTSSVKGEPVAVGSPPPNTPPSVTIDSILVSGDCIALKGTASDPDGQVAKVEVQLAARGFKPAVLNETAYQYQECGLPGGTYATQAQAADTAGAKSIIVAGPSANVSDVEAVTANWQQHMSAGRIKDSLRGDHGKVGASKLSPPEQFFDAGEL